MGRLPMLAISLFSITFAESIAVINLKEAQGPWMAGIRALKSLTKETQERRAEDLALSINRRLSRRRRQPQVRQTSVESSNLEKPNPPIVMMDDNRTMAQLLEAPTEGYEDVIVVPEIIADNF
ncbi:hypothetical protein Tco_0327202 [Tanacetum coccineum]